MQRFNELLGNGFKLGARGFLATALAVTALGLAAAPASAATVVVNTTTDQSLGSCSSSCSLRDAVATANPGDTIQVPAGHYVLTLGNIAITQSLTLAGSGARTTLIDGNHTNNGFEGGLFNMSGAINVELFDLSLINGVANFGGAIEADGLSALTIRRCTVDNNRANNGAGGVDFATGTLVVEESTFSNNTATAIAGGLFADTATGSIVNSTFSGNTASSGAAMALDESTLSLINNTITANHVSAASGGVLRAIFPQLLTLSNNVIAGNVGADCLVVRGSIVTDHNLASDNTCRLTGTGDLPGVAPLLGPLANNGGSTDTHALLSGSPALDAGNNATCPATDQRGTTRPQGPACDIGAFEVTPQDQIAALIGQLNALVTGGSLAQNKANPLITKLNQVVTKLDAGQTTAACGQLGAFINQLNADIGNGTLTPAQGQPLLDAVNALKASMGC
jgi:CSLREA domain-containing protein